jgi:DNA polymerase-3 subunit gamma/tau
MYQVIARKYRPQGFDELIGQEHVQKTLANAIESGRIAHGYIFSGQRGTGKTTVARILARCLNCIKGPTATPCGVCSACVEIAAGGAVDVIEIDAASNRGINEMREIRENVRYRPARDRYKVFIVDEAHQITREAFNALLKTLEEPPEWVVFILCTTEANEIPNTIASRCQHFTFRSVDFAEIINRMKFIAAAEGIEASEEVLSVLAQAGEGSVRDSLSAMDQAIACCGKTLRVEDVRGLLGLFGSEVLLAVANAIQQRDSVRMLAIVEDLERNGQSLQHFARELSRYWRNLLVAKISGQFTRLIAASDAEQKAFLETAGAFSEEDLTRYLHLTLELYKTLQTSLQPRLHLELGLIKLVQAGRLRSIEEVLSGLPRTAAPSAPPAPPTKAPPPGAATGNLKQDLYTALSKEGMNVSADAIEQAEVVAQGAELIVRGPKSLSFALKDKSIERLASQILGKPVRIRFEPAAAAAAPVRVEKSPAEESDLRQRALSHPGVKRFQELFPEAQVRAVRNLSE